jgi:hypothetical protein
MNAIAPDGFEIRRLGPGSYVVITPGTLDPAAQERVRRHFLDDTTIRFRVGEMA